MILTGTYQFLRLVRHAGVTFALALAKDSDESRYVWARRGPDGGWSGFAPLEFPSELRRAGMSLLTGGVEGSSRTLSDDAPFQVLSDGTFLVLLRPAKSGSAVLVDRYVFDLATLTLNHAWEVRYQRSRSKDVGRTQDDTLGATDLDGLPFLEPTVELGLSRPIRDGQFAVALVPAPASATSDFMWHFFVLRQGQDGAGATVHRTSLARDDEGLFDLRGACKLDKQGLPRAKQTDRFQVTAGGQPCALANPSATVYSRLERSPIAGGDPALLERSTHVLLALTVTPKGGAPQLATLDLAIGPDGSLASAKNAPEGQIALPVSAFSGAALSFDGRNDKVVSDSELEAGSASEATFEAWISPAEAKTSGALIGWGSNKENQPALALRLNKGTLELVQWDAKGTKTSFEDPSASMLPADTWTHVAVALESGSDPKVRFFVNGEKVGHLKASGLLSSLPSGSLSVGQAPGAGLFAGAIGDVRVWKTARSPAQISAWMTLGWPDQTGQGAAPWASKKLIAWWPLSGGSGDEAPSLAGQSSPNGKLRGPRWVSANIPAVVGEAVTWVDAAGLSIAATIFGPLPGVSQWPLGNPPVLEPSSVPQSISLLDGNDGLIHLYFLDAKHGDRASVVQFDPRVARAQRTAAWQTAKPKKGSADAGTLRFYARWSGTQMNQATVEIEASNSGTSFVDVLMTAPDGFAPIKEKWQQVPADLPSFIAVLTGAAAPSKAKALPGQVVYDYKKQVEIKPSAGADWSPPKLSAAKTYASGLFFVAADDLPDNGMPAMVQPTSAALLDRSGMDLRVQRDPTPASLAFDGSASVDFDLGKGDAQRIDLLLEGDLSLEAWVRAPSGDDRVMLMLAQTDVEDPTRRARYALGFDNRRFFAVRGGLEFGAGSGDETEAPRVAVRTPKLAAEDLEQWTHVAAIYESSFAVRLQGGAHIELPRGEADELVDAFTVEAWISADELGDQTVIGRWGPAGERAWRLRLDDEGRVRFEVESEDGELLSVASPKRAISAGARTHVAAVFDGTERNLNQLDFLAGKDAPYFWLGSLRASMPTSFTIEAWLDIHGSKQHTILSRSLAHGDGAKPGVWLGVDDNKLRLALGDHTHSASDVDPSELGLFHVAVVVRPEGDGKHSLVQWYINGEPSQEEYNTAFVVDPHADWLDWMLGGVPDSKDASKRRTPMLGQLADLRIWASARSHQEIVDHMLGPIAGAPAGLIGYWPLDSEPTTPIEFQSSGEVAPTVVIRNQVDGAEAQAEGDADLIKQLWSGTATGFTMQVYVDGASSTENTKGKTPTVSSATAAASGVPLRVGGDATGIDPFAAGVVDELRLWSMPRTAAQLGFYRMRPIQDPREQRALVSYLDFDEGRGRKVADLARTDMEGESIEERLGDDEDLATIVGGNYPEGPEGPIGLWLSSPVGARWRMLIDGVPLAVDGDAEISVDFGDRDRFRLGADAANKSGFSGQLGEVRVWALARTDEQVRATMNAALSGAEPGLVGYWRLDAGSGSHVTDESPRPIDGTIAGAKWMWPKNRDDKRVIPVGEDDPRLVTWSNGLVPNAATKLGRLSQAPLVTDAVGQARTYLFPEQDPDDDKRVRVELEDGVGGDSLERLYVGQVQFNPTLIGYIEGAPPVPVENLSVDAGSTPDKYVGTTSVALVRSETASQLLHTSSSDALGYALDFSAGTGFEFDADLEIGTIFGLPPVGVETAVVTKTNKSSFSISANASHEASFGFLASTDARTELTRGERDQLDLAGGWTVNTLDLTQLGADFYYQQPDRLYQPDNLGYALVRSSTADLFALRNRRTGATVGYMMEPAADIPEDDNIILFRMRNSYTKNGTLDGFVGFDHDPDWQQLDGTVGEKGSYFRPGEAYALERQVQRDNQRWQAILSQGDTSSDEDEGERAGEDAQESDSLAAAIDASSRGFANTYVWTAGGGLFAESLGFASSVEESSGRSYDISWSAGVSASLSQALGFGFLPKIDLSLDLAMTGKHTGVTTTSEQNQAAVQLDVSVTGEGFLNSLLPAPLPTLTLTGVATPEASSYTPSTLAGDFSKGLQDKGLTWHSSFLKRQAATPTSGTYPGPWRLSLFDSSGANIGAFTLTSDGSDTTVTQVDKGLYPLDFADTALPGKVRGYRFMSFHLPASKDNFQRFWPSSESADDGIVDTAWLYSDDPDARALRQAQSNPNAVWRVLHRVTYVSRVLPEQPPAAPVLAAERGAEAFMDLPETPDLDSLIDNVGLIVAIDNQLSVDLPDPVLGRALDEQQLEQISDATLAVLEAQGIKDAATQRDLKIEVLRWYQGLYSGGLSVPLAQLLRLPG